MTASPPAADDVDGLLSDLAAEEYDLDAMVAELDQSDWLRPTPAADWDVRDQVTHLAWVEEAARLAATDPAAFAETIVGPARTSTEFEAHQMARGRVLAGREVLEWWRSERAGALTALANVEPGARLPWFGPPMSVRSFVTARIMETWAHGQDVADALGIDRSPTDRLRHIAHLGVSTRNWSYAVRRLPPSQVPVIVELAGPSAQTWRWGPDDAADRVEGSAADFCLVVTQRRHWQDTGLRVQGSAAIEWMTIAQAFAGRATEVAPGRGSRP
jgi:uncharacterized protein (TIGR03084 family)